MADIHQFPASRTAHNRRVAAEQARRNELADYLRTVAGWLQQDDIECEPLVLTLVLSGAKGDEVVWKGYGDCSEVSLRDVANAVQQQFITPYKRRGGNFHDRRKR